jgi:hypothetical protein
MHGCGVLGDGSQFVHSGLDLPRTGSGRRGAAGGCPTLMVSKLGGSVTVRREPSGPPAAQAGCAAKRTSASIPTQNSGDIYDVAHQCEWSCR